MTKTRRNQTAATRSLSNDDNEPVVILGLDDADPPPAKKVKQTAGKGDKPGRDSPSPNGANGRGEGGRFTKGNPGGPGNPNGAKYAAMTRVLRNAVTEEDITEIAHTLTTLAKSGDLQAAKIILEYTITKAPAKLEIERATGCRPYRDWSTAELMEEVKRLEEAAAEEAAAEEARP